MDSRRPLFIDRDGVINVDVSPYVSAVDQLQIFPWTVEALRMLDAHGFDLYVISNQQGVALGITPAAELERITEAIQAKLRPHGFEIKKFYHCTELDSAHHPWRKPSPGMILAARDEFGLDLDGAYFIGDKWSDIECGARAGCKTILVLSGVTAPGAWDRWQHRPDQVFLNLKGAAEWLVGQGA